MKNLLGKGLETVYKFRHMRRWSVATLFLFCLALQASARASIPPKRPIDPLRVSCILRDEKFFTEITFNRNSDGALTGEMSHYVSLPNRGRRFLSGNVFFDISSGRRLIEGNTGDKRGNVSSFTLYPVHAALTGQWVYEQFDGNGSSTQVRFRCEYRD